MGNTDGTALGDDATGEKFPWVPPAVADLEDGPGGLNKSPCVVVLADACEKDTQASLAKVLTDIAEPMRSDDLGFYISTTNESGVAGRIRDLTKTEENKNGSMLITDIPDQGGFYAFEGEINSE